MSQPVALITGGSRGIGRAISLELARIGHAVVVNYASRADAAEAVVGEVQASGGQAIAAQGDVGSDRDRQALVDRALETFGRLDVLVNNAGITSPGRRDILEATEESWDQVFATNLKGPFFLSQRAAREMIVLMDNQVIPSGTIVNVSSISAYALSSNRADYCIAKSAMQMMTWLYAERLAEHSIRVYEVCPGVIATDMTGPVQEKYDRLIREGLSPIRRWGQPEDVARAVATLVRGELSFSTGDRINVDGGFHIRRL
jgi:NAD(P)-dependent dehydrogenase (short-subunit alcohol dehydrogenase family)